MEKLRKIVVFGGSFNPPGIHHRQIAEHLIMVFDLVLIVPCGPRPDKKSVDSSLLYHHKEMSKLTFNLPKIKFDFFDLDNSIYTPTYLLDYRYKEIYPEARIWHAVGTDLVIGGSEKKSEIHRIWDKGDEIWENLNFVIIDRPDWKLRLDDMPSNSFLLDLSYEIKGAGTKIRKHVFENKPINDLVSPDVDNYIKEKNLYM